MFFFMSSARGQTTWYVDDDANPGGNGTSWSSPYKYLQDAIAVANTSDETHIAEGIYKPDKDESGNVIPGLRTETFLINKGISLYGGY